MKRNFIQVIIAKIKGDDATVRATKIQRKAIAAFKAEISVQESQLLSLEDAVENAEADVEDALINGAELITSQESYLRNYVQAQAKLEDSIDKLENLKLHIEMLREGLAKVEKGDFEIPEVEVAETT